ncbi:DsrE/DsrF/DrsH-like family protein [Candidatus Symbiobacter mobilis]|uniref:NAD(FAD)-dependent dehydrogenase n=1 Tax=Candidatus Symbiobacter mobilis CR TaxID=946483 RepID=U5N9K1_9BURK|nr:DsrE/DsrF/DrsH-like family protein [Candidatus Symbiobacter mobilis]AGX87995.1 NAD(FAD)-dependent dehydrogenase [Candidatus Symbiobacter mobilis CR]
MRILIVGGVAGGASAAARARRLSEDAEIVLFERGEYISFANCGLPYHIGGVIADRQRLLVQTPEAMRARFRIDVRTRTEVLQIDRAGKFVLTRDLATGTERREPYDFLILSPGAEPVRPPLPGVNLPRVLTLKNMADMDAIKAKLDGGGVRKVAVIGAGYVGLEMAEALRERKLDVTLIELRKQVMEPVDPEMAAFLHQELALHRVDLRLGTAVKGFADEGNALRVELGTGESLQFDLAILVVGVKPESRLAVVAGLPVGQRGGIVVDDTMRTADPAIYAVGDVVEVTDFVTQQPTIIPLAGPANRQGRIAADNIFGRHSVYKSTQGTAVCKIFGLTVAMTGVNEKQLAEKSIPCEKVYIHPASHASYYPGASQISLKLLFDPAKGTILGAQAIGRQGVEKRIDVLAVAMRAKLSVRDLQDLELCYAPPYGSAKDPVNYLGFVATNVLDGSCGVCHVEEVTRPKPDQGLLDVRDPAEVELGMIPGAIHIPLNDLRSRMSELAKDKEWLVYCKVGLRGYLACRILLQHGFRCRNLSGGYLTYEAKLGLFAKPEHTEAELVDDSGAQQAPQPLESNVPAVRIDACGLQCPGPILRIKQTIDTLQPRQVLEITATDPGFPGDVRSWCKVTGNELLSLQAQAAGTTAVIRKQGQAAPAPAALPSGGSGKTIIVFSSDFDKVMAAFVIATGAAAMGSPVTLFFTFWGLNALRRKECVKVSKNFVERMFGWMMPRGTDKLVLSKMNMCGAGTSMIKAIMQRKNVSSLPELVKIAQESGVRLVACTMSMDLMGIKQEELIDGVEFGGVAMYLEQADRSNVNLFV